MPRPRTIVVDDEPFEWATRRRPRDERLAFWAPGHRRRAQIVEFIPSAADEWLVDALGVVGCGLRLYNLNRPAVVADLIRTALSHGWQPSSWKPRVYYGFALIQADPGAYTHERYGDDAHELAAQLIEGRAAHARQHPLAWLGQRCSLGWSELLRTREPVAVQLAIAGLVRHGFVLDQPARLDPDQRARVEVWVDARQASGEPGGLAVAHWLAGVGLDDEATRADLDRWTAALLTELSPG